MDEAQTKEQLLAEVHSLRQRLAELEAQGTAHQSIEQILHAQTCILDTVRQAVIGTNLDGQIIYWNHYAEALYGWSATEVQGHNILEVTPTPMSQAQAAEIMAELRAGKEWTGEFYVQRRDGTAFPALVTNSPLRNEQGVLLGIIGFSVDLTSRKELEAQLREETETVETINRVGQLLSAELDLQKLVQIVTDAATELTGAEFGAFFYNIIDQRGERYTLYTLSGAPYEAFAQFPMPRNTEVFGPTFRGESVIRLSNVREDPRYGQNSPFFGMPPGHLPVTSYLAVPVVSRSGEIIGGLFFGHSEPDIFTERAERIVVGLAAQTAIAMDNARLYQEAQQAISIRDEFLSMAAHELKTPITSIMGYIQVLQRRAQREGHTTERDSRALHTIAEQAERLNQLISSLFDLSRIQMAQLTLDWSIVDLEVLTRRIVEETQSTLEQHSISFICASSQPLLVRGDALRLEQVVQNLVHNAIKYSPSGGVIDIRLEVIAPPEAADGLNSAALSITDHGMGIPTESLPLIFRRFYRAKNVQHTHINGVGVGLYVAHEIVVLHGGNITVESTESVGSTFRVILPLHQPLPNAEEADPSMACTSQPAERLNIPLQEEH
jgi:PAS domain S-box-containing protein